MLKRGFAWLLCLCMMISAMPAWTPALAEGEEEVMVEEIVIEEITIDEEPEQEPEKAPEKKPEQEPETKPEEEAKDAEDVEIAEEPENKKQDVNQKQMEEEPAEEPTEEPEAEEEQEADQPFGLGYVRLKKTSRVYDYATKDDCALQVESGSIAYAIKRPNEGGSIDRYEVILNIEGNEFFGYVDAAAVTLLSEGEAAGMTGSVYADEKGQYPLPAAAYAAYTEEKEELPEASVEEVVIDAAEEPETEKAEKETEEETEDVPPAGEVVEEMPEKTQQDGFADRLENKAAGVSVKNAQEIFLKEVIEGEYNTSNAMTGSEFQAQDFEILVGNNSSGDVKFTWDRISGSQGFRVERAQISLSTGNIGKRKIIAEKKTTSTTKYTDTSAELGKLYRYYISQYRIIGNTKYLRGYYFDYYNAPTLSIKTCANVDVGSTVPAVKLEWNAYKYVMNYYVYRSKENASNYELIATLGNTYTNYTDYPTTSGLYYYRIIPTYNVLGLQDVANPSGTKRVFCAKTVASSAYSDGSGYIGLNWQSNSAATGYRIDRAVISQKTGSVGSYKTLATKNSTDVFYKDKTAEADTLYRYRIRQYVTSGSTKYYSAPAYIDQYSMKKVSVSCSSLDSNTTSIGLKWSKRTNAFRYDVYYSESKEGPFSLLVSTSGTTYTHRPSVRKTYYYKVQPYASVLGTTYTTSESSVKALGYPVPPKSVEVAGKGSKSVKVTWEKADNAKGYVVYRSSSINGTYKKVGETTSERTLTDNAAYSGVVNYYKVRSYIKMNDKRIYSDYSDPVGVFPLKKVSGLAGSKLSTTSVQMSWNAVPNAQKYIVYRSYSSSGPFDEIGSVTSTSCRVNNLTESYEKVYFKIQAYRQDGAIVSVSERSSNLSIRKNPQTLRNLYIIEENFTDANKLPNDYKNGTALLSKIMSKGTPGNLPVTTKYQYKDQSWSQVKSRIATMAGLADSNDITFFYLSCHGVQYTDGTYANQLCMSDGTRVPVADLATELKKIPGRVVIVLNACGSGLAINMSADDTEMSMALDPQSFDAAVIEAFAAADEQIEWENDDLLIEEPVTGETMVTALSDNTPMNGELCVSNKFYVITAARGTEYSWTNSANGAYLLQWMNSGLYNADTNGNKAVTLAEMGNYLEKKGKNTWITDKDNKKHRMIPQVYPANSSFVLFK